jgi:hypothetical protein
MPWLNEGDRITDVVKHEAEDRHCREARTIGSGAALLLGTVLALNPAGSMAVSAAVANGGNTGDGTITLAATAFAEDVIMGTYNLTCTAASADGGTFELLAPDGNVVDQDILVGVESDNSHLIFTVNDGAADFVVGDSYAIAANVTAEGKYYQLAPDAEDGTEIATAILLQDCDASAADVNDVLLIVRGPATVSKRGLVWPVGITADEKATALAHLEAAGIVAREGA